MYNELFLYKELLLNITRQVYNVNAESCFYIKRLLLNTTSAYT